MPGPNQKYLFTSESVTEGHPDKVCDQISDAVLDAVLAADPKGRVACESMAKDQTVYVMGEITTSANPDIEKLVRVRAVGNTPVGWRWRLLHPCPQPIHCELGGDHGKEQAADDAEDPLGIGVTRFVAVAGRRLKFRMGFSGHRQKKTAIPDRFGAAAAPP